MILIKKFYFQKILGFYLNKKQHYFYFQFGKIILMDHLNQIN